MRPIPLPDGTTEDTTSVLKKVAAQMQTWYGQERQTAEIVLKQPGTYLDLGTFLTNLNCIASTFQINTIVTSAKTSYKDQTTTYRTSFFELDYADMAGRKEDLSDSGDE